MITAPCFWHSAFNKSNPGSKSTCAEMLALLVHWCANNAVINMLMPNNDVL